MLQRQIAEYPAGLLKKRPIFLGDARHPDLVRL
jgi:hypothetical protein